MMTVSAIMIGFCLDLLLGDPHWLYHPVRLIGALINCWEKWLRRLLGEKPLAQIIAGFLLVGAVLSTTFGVVFLLLSWAGTVSLWLQLAMEGIMCYQILAVKSLKTESMKVYAALQKNDLLLARQEVSMIVGRDTKHLTETQVIKATVETIAENTADGVIAPLFYLALGGAPLGFLYKAVNTMDSMIGYQNERYRYFGRAAAKLDDLFNYLPARLAALLMLVAAKLAKLDVKEGWRIYKRDRHQHASPNSAQTEAVCAGVLRVQLAGDAYYFGELHHKPTIGDDWRSIEAEDIKRANRLLYLTAFLAVFLLLVVKIIFLTFGG